MGYTGNVHHVITLQWKKPANYLECVGGPAFVGVYKLFSEKFSELHSASVFSQLIRDSDVIMVDSNKASLGVGPRPKFSVKKYFRDKLATAGRVLHQL